MPGVVRNDITWSCAELGMHGERCSRPDTCQCFCHIEEEDQ